MRVNEEEKVICLSERNLKVLLSKLNGHPPNSACTIIGGLDHAPEWIVSAEPDEVHYADRIPAGEMHPETEAQL